MSKVGQLVSSSGGFVQGGEGGWGLITGVWFEGDAVIILLFLSLYDRLLLWVCSWYILVSLKELLFQNAFESSSLRVFWKALHEMQLKRGSHLGEVRGNAACEIWGDTLHHLLARLLIFLHLLFLLGLKLWHRVRINYRQKKIYRNDHARHTLWEEDSPRP